MTPQQIYQWLIQLIAKWPETKVTMTWGEPHFRVGDKIFSGWGAHKDGRYSMGIKLDKDKQAAMVASDPRFAIAPYVGKHGWVSFHPGEEPDLGEVEALLMESYRNVAPKSLVARMESGEGAATAARRPAGKASTVKATEGKQKPAAKKPAAKKPAAKKPAAKKPAATAAGRKAAATPAKQKPAIGKAAVVDGRRAGGRKASAQQAPAARATKPMGKAKRR